MKKEEIITRRVRYQGAIIRNHNILLIRHTEHSSGRSYWVIPGGGLKEKETEEECVRREMLEETNLVVLVKKLLLDFHGLPGDIYKKYLTYRCEPISGEPTPGVEPETEAARKYSITDTRWFNLPDQGNWDRELVGDIYTFPQMRMICDKLGYGSGGCVHS